MKFLTAAALLLLSNTFSAGAAEEKDMVASTPDQVPRELSLDEDPDMLWNEDGDYEDELWDEDVEADYEDHQEHRELGNYGYSRSSYGGSYGGGGRRYYGGGNRNYRQPANRPVVRQSRPIRYYGGGKGKGGMSMGMGGVGVRRYYGGGNRNYRQPAYRPVVRQSRPIRYSTIYYGGGKGKGKGGMSMGMGGGGYFY